MLKTVPDDLGEGSYFEVTKTQTIRVTDEKKQKDLEFLKEVSCVPLEQRFAKI